jgi:hypothetical protein
MDNGPARQAGIAHQLQKAGDAVADMFEVRFASFLIQK